MARATAQANGPWHLFLTLVVSFKSFCGLKGVVGSRISTTRPQYFSPNRCCKTFSRQSMGSTFLISSNRCNGGSMSREKKELHLLVPRHGGHPPTTPASLKQAELTSPKGVIAQAVESPNRGARANQSLIHLRDLASHLAMKPCPIALRSQHNQ